MTDSNRIRIAHGLAVAAAGITVFWLVQLYPFLTHTGPAPGAGAQYVFVLLPTLAFATLASLTAVSVAGPVLWRDRSLRTPFSLAALIAGTALSLLLVVFWVRLAANAAS
jgi:hypothetical protein